MVEIAADLLQDGGGGDRGENDLDLVLAKDRGGTVDVVVVYACVGDALGQPVGARRGLAGENEDRDAGGGREGLDGGLADAALRTSDGDGLESGGHVESAWLSRIGVATKGGRKGYCWFHDRLALLILVGPMALRSRAREAA